MAVTEAADTTAVNQHICVGLPKQRAWLGADLVKALLSGAFW